MNALQIETNKAKLFKEVGSGVYFLYFQCDNFVSYHSRKGTNQEIIKAIHEVL